VMDAAGVESLPTPAGKVSVRRSGKPAFEFEGDAPPADVAVTKVEFSKSKAYDLWRATGAVPAGVRVVFSRSLRVT